jgi:hypothetical protein
MPGPSHALREPLLARAKNTLRAEARRRTREQMRAELAAESGEAVADESVEPGPTLQPRRPMFKMPNFRGDIAALPGIFRTRRLLWVPLLLLVVGFVLTLQLPALPPDVATIPVLFVQFFFLPPALFTFFIAGFLAPRGSYLVGLIYGLIAGVLWFIAFTPASSVTDPTTFLTMLAVAVFNGALYGTLAAAFAAWYRDFLRQMQERGKVRRAEQEAKLRAQRRQERQETRRPAKRPTT